MRSKLEATIGPYGRGKLKKQNHFIKNLSPYSFFKQSSSKFYRKSIIKF